MWLALLTVFLYSSVCSGQEVTDAKILASKFLLSNYAVESKEFVVDYRLYNVGEKTALKVTLVDNNFPAERFEVVKGLLAVYWDRMAPGTNVTHSVILRPLYYGVINYTSAEVSYYPSDTADKARVGYTTSSGEGYIYKLRDYERKFASRYFDWLMFAAMVMPSVVLPALLWLKSKRKYEQLGAKEQKNVKTQ